PDAPAVVRNVGFLIDAAHLLEMTVQATEQYPRGLGPTAAAIAARLPHRPDKIAFSSCAVAEVVDAFHTGARPTAVPSALDTPGCSPAAVGDLLALAFRVYIAVDAVAARYPTDPDTALRRLEQAGAILTTAEGCVFEWVGGAGHARFKDISRLVQERMKTF